MITADYGVFGNLDILETSQRTTNITVPKIFLKNSEANVSERFQNILTNVYLVTNDM